VNTRLRYLKRLVIWLGSLSQFLVLIFSAFSLFIAYPYYKIEVGMSENRVIEIFSDSHPRIDRAKSAFLCDIKAWYSDCKIIEDSGATHFLLSKYFSIPMP
jgi:acyl carrier protein phosphodiesterase